MGESIFPSHVVVSVQDCLFKIDFVCFSPDRNVHDHSLNLCVKSYETVSTEEDQRQMDLTDTKMINAR